MKCFALSWYLLLLVLASCGDGLRAGPPDAADRRVPPISADVPAAEPPPACWGAEQLGCEAGEKCGVSGTEWMCQADGSRALRETCSEGPAGDSCQAGLHCYQGTCYALCNDSVSCAGDDTRCVAAPEQAPDLALCLDECSPLSQDCMDSASGKRQGCYLSLSGPVCAPISTSPPTVPGLACEYLNDCAAGSGCMRHNGQNLCLAYCDYENNANASDPSCAAGDRCRNLENAFSIGVCHE